MSTVGESIGAVGAEGHLMRVLQGQVEGFTAPAVAALPADEPFAFEVTAAVIEGAIRAISDLEDRVAYLEVQ